MPSQRELSRQRLAAIRSAEAKGSLGPFAPDPHPKDSKKLSPLNPGASAKSTNAANQDRISQEKALGMTRGRKAAYKGD